MTLSREERLQSQREDRALASQVLNGALFWRFVHALDVIGWKIVPQDAARGDMRFSAPAFSKRKKWPSWIEHEKPQPKLRLLDGGKRDDGEQDR